MLSKSKIRKIVLLILLFLYSVELAQAGAETWINDQLEDGGRCVIPAGTHIITDSIILTSGCVLEGEPGAIIKLGDGLTWSEWKPAIKGTSVSNVKVGNFEIDGNEAGQNKVPTWSGHTGKEGKKLRGQGYQLFMHFIDCDDVEVYNMVMHDGISDGCRVKTSTNVKFHDNTAYRLGHDCFFAIDSQNIEAYNNRLTTRTNSALRLWNVQHARFYSNTIDAQLDSVGGNPGIQIEDSKGQMSDIEICNNIIFKTWGSGIWLIAYDAGVRNSQDVYIHHNLFWQVAQSYNINYAAGITCGGQAGTVVKNNVFDGTKNTAWNGLSDGQGALIQDNIITNTVNHAGGSQAGSGYGIANKAGSDLSIISNCFYDNLNGNCYKCSSSGDDLQDPRTHSTSSGWTWTGSTWTCAFVPPMELGKIAPTNTSGTIDTDQHEIIFDDIFDVFKITFSDNGRTGQTAEDIPLQVAEKNSGIIAGGLKIVGFKDRIVIDNVSYIPDDQAVLIQTKVIQNPDLDQWTGIIKQIDKKVSVKIDNGTAYATLKVKTSWYTKNKNSLTGKSSKSKIRTATATFKDSVYPAPEILTRPAEKTGYINEYRSKSNPNTRVYVDPECLQKIVYEYDGNTSTHTFLIGERLTDDAGVYYTVYTRADSWGGQLSGLDNSFIIYGPFDPEKLKVTCYTPYENFTIEEWKHNIHELEKKAWATQQTEFILKFLLMLFCGYKLMRIIIPP